MEDHLSTAQAGLPAKIAPGGTSRVDHRAGMNTSSRADMHALENNRADSDPDVVIDDYRPRNQSRFLPAIAIRAVGNRILFPQFRISWDGNRNRQSSRDMRS